MNGRLFAYLFGDSQVETALEAAREHIEEVLDAAETEAPLKSKRTPLASALKALGIEAGEDALQYGPEGFSLVYDDNETYRDACIKLVDPEGMEKLADLGWVALRGGDHTMSGEPAEFHIRFVDISTAETTDADKPSQSLDAIIKAGREFATKEPEHDAENPVEHPDKAVNNKHAGMSDAKDGADPEGKPKGSTGKTESNEASEIVNQLLDYVNENLDSVNEGRHRAGCACNFCKNMGKGFKKKEEPDKDKPDEDKSDNEPADDKEPDKNKSNDSVEHTFEDQEPPRYTAEKLAMKRGRPKTVKNKPVAKAPKSGKVGKAYKTARK